MLSPNLEVNEETDQEAPHLQPRDPVVSSLFEVTDVAVVGASPGKYYSSNVLKNLVARGMPPERVYPVNPGHQSIDGLTCYPDLRSLPRTPSLVISLVGTGQVDSVLDEVIATEVPAMMVLADGFAESGGDGIERQAALAEKAARHRVALLGPNSLGYASPAHGLGAWVAGTLPELVPGNLALVFQSSGMLNVVMSKVAERRIGLRGALSVGNEAVIDVADLVRYYARDEECSVIGLVLESTTRPQELATALLEAHEAGKILVVLGIGKSERGMLNAVSHAGRLATNGAVWDALYRQVGAVVVEDLSDFLETVALAGGMPVDADDARLALITISGGDCGLLSDMAETLAVDLADVHADTKSVLNQELARDDILPNPLDVRNTLTTAPDVFWRCLTAVASDENVDVVGLRMLLPPLPTEALVEKYTEIARLVREADTQCVFMSRVAEVSSPAWYDLFASLGTPFLTSYGGALRAFAHLQRRNADRALVDPGATFSAVPESPQPIQAGVAEGWEETTAWLRKWDLPYVASALVDSPDEAADQAVDLGFPVALKGVLPGLAHKTEHQLVRLGIADETAAIDAATDLFERMADLDPSTPAKVEVQAMAGDGAEVFLGAYRDPILGPVITFGLGGIFLEVLRDVIHALPPITPEQAESLLTRLKGWPVLNGARGKEASDVAALAELVSHFSEAVAADAATIGSVDLNPVLVYARGHGLVAVDAFVERLTSE